MKIPFKFIQSLTPLFYQLECQQVFEAIFTGKSKKFMTFCRFLLKINDKMSFLLF